MANGDIDLSKMRAVILAGGKGTRLQPFTVTFPKPLMPLGDNPILEILLFQLADAGFRHVTLSLGHLSSLIRAFISQHNELNEKLHIDFVEESSPTGTAGSLSSIRGLGDTFIVMNGDLLTDICFLDLIAHHVRSGAALTIGSYLREQKTDFGILETNQDGMLVDYVEKPEHVFLVSMGIYVYQSNALKYIMPMAYLDFPDLVKTMLRNGERIASYNHRGVWLDIGRPDDYARAQELHRKTISHRSGS
jgi:NDP-sugar pyrophosphorylase family protein